LPVHLRCDLGRKSENFGKEILRVTSDDSKSLRVSLKSPRLIDFLLTEILLKSANAIRKSEISPHH